MNTQNVGTPDSVELEIMSSLDTIVDVDKAEGLGDREWTKMVKAKLCELGRKHGYGVNASGCENGEWLFDLVWCDGKDKPWEFWEMPLAMECEWSTDTGEIEYDFEKLLVVRAKYRLFIFQGQSREEVDERMAWLKNKVRVFKSFTTGDRYLLAGFYCYPDKAFEYVSLVI
jgi:hypothetical protein